VCEQVMIAGKCIAQVAASVVIKVNKSAGWLQT
jgi:hypothetical protein